MKTLTYAFIIILFIGLLGSTINHRILKVEGQNNLLPPEFTIHLEAHPYYVPAEYEINPYTGFNRTIHTGYTAENKSLVFRIKNQPFTPNTDTEGNLIQVFYKIQIKGN